MAGRLASALRGRWPVGLRSGGWCDRQARVGRAMAGGPAARGGSGFRARLGPEGSPLSRPSLVRLPVAPATAAFAEAEEREGAGEHRQHDGL